MEFFQSNKALLIAAALFIVAILKALNILSVDQAAALVAVLGGLGVVANHAGVKKNAKDIAVAEDNLRYSIGNLRSDVDSLNVGMRSVQATVGSGKIMGEDDK